MKIFFIILIFYILQYSNSFAEVKLSNYKDYKITNIKFQLEEISTGLNYPWGMTFIDDKNLLITEKSGRLLKVSISTGEKIEIDHELNIFTGRQGGLLDVLYHNNYVYFTYSHLRDNSYSSSAIARGKIINNNIVDTEILLSAEPKLKTTVHFGSRIVIRDKYLFASFGERGEGMIAQDPTSHPGSIIRIHLDGSVPEDNPRFINQPTWLAEIYQIGVRNPQGMALSPFNNEIYISNHGAKGGDFIGTVNKSGNYGWKIIGWGGENYLGTKIGDGESFKAEYDMPLISWIPSIAPSNIQFYNKNMFKDWRGDLLVTSLKFRMLIRLEIENNKVIDEEIILRGCKIFNEPCQNIGRIRDIEIDKNGSIYIITDEPESSLWKISKENK
tara:strand:- start:488 stop:1645 length:1158 start_codon:yes stop_codon:yes gene_type:complete